MVPASYLMSKIGQCFLDPCVAPRGILQRHSHDEINDILHHTRASRTSPTTTVPPGSYQLPVPPHQRIGRHQGLEFLQYLAPQYLGFPRKLTSFRVSEVNLPFTQASLENAVLFLQIVDHFKMVAVDPTSEDDEQKLKRWKQWKHDEE